MNSSIIMVNHRTVDHKWIRMEVIRHMAVDHLTVETYHHTGDPKWIIMEVIHLMILMVAHLMVHHIKIQFLYLIKSCLKKYAF